MKTNTIRERVGCCIKGLVFFALFASQALIAQMQNNGDIYIHDFAEVHISAGNFNFGTSPATTTTSRSTNYGFLSFASGVTWSGATSAHFVDGYIRSYGTDPFVMPIGQTGVYAPIKVVPTTNVGVDAAYYFVAPSSIGTSIGSTISAISDVEYWNVKSNGSDALITLSWSSTSDVNTLTASTLESLTIVGFNGTSWEEIPSTVDATSLYGLGSSLDSGSISSTTVVDLDMYNYFTLGYKGSLFCGSSYVTSGITKTWDGINWTPSSPTIQDNVIVNQPFSGNLSCYSLILNADITLEDGQLVEIVNGVTGTGKIVMSSEASVVQHNNIATAPNIQLTKLTNPMRRYDYVFISSPINSSPTFFSQILNKNNVAVNGDFGIHPASAFNQLRTYDTAGLAAINANAANTPIGRGFSATVRNQVPYSPSIVQDAWDFEKYSIQIKTVGVANNGDISITVPANGWARIGNPYPSAIDGELLLDATGANVRQTLYYWTFNTPRGTIENNSSYNNADFATWNRSGGTAACATCEVPTGIIATMQSVMVKASNATPSTFNLTNCMRTTTGNNNFYRTLSSNDRYWLNLTGSLDSFSQILIAYNEDATYGEDPGYDGLKIGGAITSSIASLIGTSKYAIQTRPEFDNSDSVPLQVDKNVDETLSIQLGNKEGIFNNGTVSIFLHDTQLGIYHDLASGPYSFIQTATSDSNRFEIVYQSETLGNNDFSSNNAVAFIKNKNFNAQTNGIIKNIQVFDLSGRFIIEYKDVDSNMFSKPFYYAQGVYIAKINLDSGLTVTQKLIND